MTSTLKWAKICPPWMGALQFCQVIQLLVRKSLKRLKHY